MCKCTCVSSDCDEDHTYTSAEKVIYIHAYVHTHTHTYTHNHSILDIASCVESAPNIEGDRRPINAANILRLNLGEFTRHLQSTNYDRYDRTSLRGVGLNGQEDEFNAAVLQVGVFVCVCVCVCVVCVVWGSTGRKMNLMPRFCRFVYTYIYLCVCVCV
jgi:hypothetical protein